MLYNGFCIFLMIPIHVGLAKEEQVSNKNTQELKKWGLEYRDRLCKLRYWINFGSFIFLTIKF